VPRRLGVGQRHALFEGLRRARLAAAVDLQSGQHGMGREPAGDARPGRPHPAGRAHAQRVPGRRRLPQRGGCGLVARRPARVLDQQLGRRRPPPRRLRDRPAAALVGALIRVSPAASGAGYSSGGFPKCRTSMARSTAKARTAYVCSECGAEFNKWQGQCGECGAWNTLSEIVLESAAAAKSPAARRSGWAGKVDAPNVTALKDVRHHEDARVTTGIGEFDRVLGGGLVEGAVVLVGGDPGIGKSTLLLQAVARMAATLPGLYVTGEESLAQVAGRGARLGLPLDGV